MKWIVRSPEFGDMIRIKSGNIYHYGIFASETEVIQFGLAPDRQLNIPNSEIEVCTSDFEEFSRGETVEVGVCENPTEAAKRRSPSVTVETARAALGQRGYSIIHNNCEHFAYICATGERFCSQTVGARELFRNFPIVDVYVVLEKSCDTERALIEYALNRSFGKKPNDANLRLVNGLWEASVCKIAVAKHDRLIAVCVSRGDIELELSDEIDNAVTDSSWWRKNTETCEIRHSVSIKTATPQRVRLYNSLNIDA